MDLRKKNRWQLLL